MSQGGCEGFEQGVRKLFEGGAKDLSRGCENFSQRIYELKIKGIKGKEALYPHHIN